MQCKLGRSYSLNPTGLSGNTSMIIMSIWLGIMSFVRKQSECDTVQIRADVVCIYMNIMYGGMYASSSAYHVDLLWMELGHSTRFQLLKMGTKMELVCFGFCLTSSVLTTMLLQ